MQTEVCPQGNFPCYDMLIYKYMYKINSGCKPFHGSDPNLLQMISHVAKFLATLSGGDLSKADGEIGAGMVGCTPAVAVGLLN
mmetsp:Transcript_26336/g.34609  ORF Transcript_26336/g.34609 Transcript_26336/m.34609 type:complete len:83 (+) Transcript_26336:202-450(+)